MFLFRLSCVIGFFSFLVLLVGRSEVTEIIRNNPHAIIIFKLFVSVVTEDTSGTKRT